MIETLDERQVIGTANLVDLDWKNSNAFHGMMLGPVEMRRKGSAKPAHGAAPQEARTERLRQEELRRETEKLPQDAPLPKPFDGSRIA